MTKQTEGWLQLSVHIDGVDLDAVETALYEVGALSLTLKDAADQPLLEPGPGELPLWDKVIVDALFDPAINPEQLNQELQQYLSQLSIGDISIAFIKDQVWERAWMDRFKPMQFGTRLWIYPTHIPPASDASVNVLLDPGLAFGSGTHPTTALCLEWLDGFDLNGKTLIDYGCGSGVLAIAACKLGAERVYACDIDPQALTATRDNARLNGVDDKIIVAKPDALPVTQADIVLANILSSILLQLQSTLTGLVAGHGRLVLSGILQTQADSVRSAYQADIDFDRQRQKEDWVLLYGSKKK